MPNLKIKLPTDILNAPEEVRRQVLATLEQAMKLPKVQPVHTKGIHDEHNIWSRNGDEMTADAEDEFYEWLIAPAMERMADVFAALDLPTDALEVDKAFTLAYSAFDDELRKAKGDGKRSAKRAFSDLIAISKEKREAFLKYLNDANPLNKQQISALEKMLRAKLPEYASKVVEAFQVRAGLLGKIRSVADRELFTTVGAYVDRFPETIRAVEREHTVLTLPEKRRAEAEGRKVTILPLTPMEVRAVEHATHSAAEKIAEVNDRHIAGIKQLVIRAKKERWTSQNLAQELYDLYGEQNRDWRRVAITELAMASSDAFLSGVEEGETVVGMSAANTCKHCLRLITSKTLIVTNDPDKMTEEHGYTHVWAGKSNFGRTANNWWPCIPLHPNCRCRWHKISRFYKMGEDGKLVLKTTAELIQEERKRLGMEPDHNLKTE